MKKKMMMLLCLCALFAGCAGETVQEETDKTQGKQDGKAPAVEETVSSDVTDKETTPKGYLFQSGEVTIYVDQDMSEILAGLGEADTYFEAPSCAFEGKDKIYTYSHFIIYTYPMGDKDFVSSVVLMDDFVETPEGICIGAAMSDVKAAYGTECTETKGACTYSKEGMKLLFLYDEEEYVTSIQYSSGILDAEN